MSSGSEQQRAAAGSSIDPDPSKEAKESSTSKKKTYAKLKNQKLPKQEKDAGERKEAKMKEKQEAEAGLNRLMEEGIIESWTSFTIYVKK